MASITVQMLKDRLAEVQRQREQLLADLNACDGAEQALASLIVEAEKDNIQ